MVPCPRCTNLCGVRDAIKVGDRLRYRCKRCVSAFDVADALRERPVSPAAGDSTPIVSIRPVQKSRLGKDDDMSFEDETTNEVTIDVTAAVEERESQVLYVLDDDQGYVFDLASVVSDDDVVAASDSAPASSMPLFEKAGALLEIALDPQSNPAPPSEGLMMQVATESHLAVNDSEAVEERESQVMFRLDDEQDYVLESASSVPSFDPSKAQLEMLMQSPGPRRASLAPPTLDAFVSKPTLVSATTPNERSHREDKAKRALAIRPVGSSHPNKKPWAPLLTLRQAAVASVMIGFAGVTAVLAFGVATEAQLDRAQTAMVRQAVMTRTTPAIEPADGPPPAIERAAMAMAEQAPIELDAATLESPPSPPPPPVVARRLAPAPAPAPTPAAAPKTANKTYAYPGLRAGSKPQLTVAESMSVEADRAYHAGDLNRAGALYRDALAISPRFIPARLGAAAVDWDAGRVEQARARYRLIVADAPSLVPALAKERAR